MACIVFGNPVSDDMVRKNHPNLTKITIKHRAELALQFMNAEETVMEIKKCVENLMATLHLPVTSTLGVAFNATGGDMTFVLKHTWDGQALKPYPKIIQNGQWAVFLHVGVFGPSKEAIVYRGSNVSGTLCDWMLAWNTTKGDSQNHVLTQIREAGHFETVNWNDIDCMMENQTNFHRDSWNGCFSAISVGTGSSTKLVAIMSLDCLPPNFMAMARDVSVVSKWLN